MIKKYHSISTLIFLLFFSGCNDNGNFEIILGSTCIGEDCGLKSHPDNNIDYFYKCQNDNRKPIYIECSGYSWDSFRMELCEYDGSSVCRSEDVILSGGWDHDGYDREYTCVDKGDQYTLKIYNEDGYNRVGCNVADLEEMEIIKSREDTHAWTLNFWIPND